MPAKDLKELLAYIKANKDKVTFANAGIGSASHLCGLLFMSAIEVDLTTVPYKGTAPAMNDLLGGQVDLLCDQTTQTTPYIKAGRVKAYGTTSETRLDTLKDLPTLAEAGLPGFEVVVWHGVYAPKGTPKPVLDKLIAALQAAIAGPGVRAADGRARRAGRAEGARPRRRGCARTSRPRSTGGRRSSGRPACMRSSPPRSGRREFLDRAHRQDAVDAR